MDLKWVNSGGGPLICATPLACEKWRGVNGSSVGDARTDYERACDELDYVGVVPCTSFEVLVLGDEPLQSSFAMVGDDLVIVRWVDCVSGERAAAAISSLPSQLPPIEKLCQFSVNEPRLLLFDAALDNLAMPDARSSFVELEPGRYQVSTEKYEQDHEFEFLIHRLRQLTGA